MSQPEQTMSAPAAAAAAVVVTPAAPDLPSSGSTPANYNHPAWRADREKILALEAKIDRLLISRRVMTRLHRDEEHKLRRDRDSVASTAQKNQDLELQAQLAQAQHEAVVWKKRYNERLVAVFRGALGMALALEQAKEKVREQDAVVGKLREELALASVGGVADYGEATTTTGRAPEAVFPTAAGSSSSGQGMASTIDMEAFSAAATLVSLSAGEAASFGPSPIPPNQDNAQTLATISRQLVDKKVELARTAHQREQQAWIACSEQAEALNLADQLSSTHVENEELRGRIKCLTAELHTTQNRLADAERRVWEEKTSRPSVLVQDLGKANDRLDSFIKKSGQIFRNLWEAMGEKLAFARGVETRQVVDDDGGVGEEVRAWHPDGGDISLAAGLEHLNDTCRDCEIELRERRESFDELVKEARREVKKARKAITGREEEEINHELAQVLDDRGGEGLTAEDLFHWDERDEDLFVGN